MESYKFGFSGFKTVEESMAEKKYVVPEGGLKAALSSQNPPFVFGQESGIRAALEAFVRWQSESSPMPTDEQLRQMMRGFSVLTKDTVSMIVMEWIRRIYLVPEPEVPEEIKDLLCADIGEGFFKPEILNKRMVECFRRGQKSRSTT